MIYHLLTPHPPAQKKKKEKKKKKSRRRYYYYKVLECKKNTSSLFLTHILELLDSHHLDPLFFTIPKPHRKSKPKKMSDLGGASMVRQNPRRVTAPEEALEFETSKEVQVVTSFAEMGIKDDLLRGIYQYGFEKPSAIQQRAVVPILQGRDVIAQAQSGTGKTSMIGLTVCQTVDTSSRECVLLISFLFSLLCFFFHCCLN